MKFHLTATGCHLPDGITCHPTQVNTSHRNPSQTGWYSIYSNIMDGWMDAWIDRSIN